MLVYFANKFTGEIRNIGENSTNFPDGAVVTWVSRSIRGGYWVGTQANGIYFMVVEDNDEPTVSFTQIEADSYLSNLSIGAIIEDQENNIKKDISKNNEIDEVSKKTLKEKPNFKNVDDNIVDKKSTKKSKEASEEDQNNNYITMRQSLRDAMAEEMRKNDKVFVTKRGEILSMIWDMEEEIMGKEI